METYYLGNKTFQNILSFDYYMIIKNDKFWFVQKGKNRSLTKWLLVFSDGKNDFTYITRKYEKLHYKNKINTIIDFKDTSELSRYVHEQYKLRNNNKKLDLIKEL